MTNSDTPDHPPEFSIVLGGLIHRFYLWSGLSNDPVDHKYRRIVVISAFTWLPLLLLSLVDGHAFGNSVNIPFLRDIVAHVRFLVALPALLLADSVAHDIIAPRIRMFVVRNIIRDEDLPKFRAAIDAAHRMRDSAALEIALMIVVYGVGIWVWQSQIALAGPTWYAAPDGTSMNLTRAGYWFLLISLPIFQFLLLRWYMRIVIWVAFLFRVARLNLILVATHSDRSAGLGFLGQCAYGFAPLLFAEGALVSAYIASEIMYAGRSLTDYKLEPAIFVIVFLLMVLGPLTIFTPRMITAKWRDLIIYGALVSRYVEGFDRRWIAGAEPPGKDLLGADDIQSLADLSNSYAVLQSMRPVPFEVRDVVWLIAPLAVPLLPLLLFTFSVEDIFDKLIKVLF
jgi:hypothetical protein